MCGVVGVIGSREAAKETFLGLIALQHRGQDAAGILSYDKGFHEVKNLGLVESVFTRESMEALTGDMAVGHARYATVGRGELKDVQPLTLNFPYGMGLVHNGNIVNYHRLKDRLREEKKRLCFSSSDSEALLNWLADELRSNNFEGMKVAVRSVFRNVQGAYSVAGILAEGGLFAFRDPNGLRPLVLGRRELPGDNGEIEVSYMVASESIALQVNGYELLRDLDPGELVFIRTREGQEPELLSGKLENQKSHPCMFEWVYFAAAESEVEGTPVYGARLALGRALAKEVKARMDRGEIEADLVAPVPDTSRPAASALAEALGLPYREVLIKNRYIKRTFILGTQSQRSRAVDLKLNPVRSELLGKSVLLVDDSIVRGTTSRRLVDLVRRAGAKRVYFLSTCPPIKYPCFYGIDFPDQGELLAAGRTDAEVAGAIGADGVVYLDTKNLLGAIAEAGGGRVKEPCAACLTGDYPTDVRESERFARMRKLERSAGGAKT